MTVSRATLTRRSDEKAEWGPAPPPTPPSSPPPIRPHVRNPGNAQENRIGWWMEVEAGKANGERTRGGVLLWENPPRICCVVVGRH